MNCIRKAAGNGTRQGCCRSLCLPQQLPCDSKSSASPEKPQQTVTILIWQAGHSSPRRPDPTAMAQPPFSPSCTPRRPPPSTSSTLLASPLPFSSYWSPTPRHAAHRRAVAAASSLHLGLPEITELAHNEVLIAATVASAIGQLSKPFTSAKNGGVRLDLRTAFRSGGMPSTHTASVVAVVTSLGLERGFADSIFGMSVVFAAIVMYDAQIAKLLFHHCDSVYRHVMETKSFLELCPSDGLVILMGVAESIPPVSGRAGELMCSIQNLLTIIVLGDQQFLLNCLQPIICNKRLSGVRECGWLGPHEFSQLGLVVVVGLWWWLSLSSLLHAGYCLGYPLQDLGSNNHKLLHDHRRWWWRRGFYTVVIAFEVAPGVDHLPE